MAYSLERMELCNTSKAQSKPIVPATDLGCISALNAAVAASPASSFLGNTKFRLVHRLFPIGAATLGRLQPVVIGSSRPGTDIDAFAVSIEMHTRRNLAELIIHGDGHLPAVQLAYSSVSGFY